MGMAPNPLRDPRPADPRLSSHAEFRMHEREIDQSLIRKLVMSPEADYEIDMKSGHYVFRAKDYRIVMKKNADGSFIVLSIISKDQLPL
jgi:hypothetical protein